HVFLQAAQRLKAKGLVFQVKVIGEGPERKILETQADALQLNDRVAFLGHLPVPLVDRTLDEAAALVMPSLGGEVFGLVAAENMMRGRTLIVSDLGALSEIVDDAGLKAVPGDIESLTRCLEMVLASPTLSANLGHKAQLRAMEFFHIERMLNDHLAVYKKVL